MLLCVGDLIEDVVVWLPGPVALGSDTVVRITRARGGSAANVAAAAVRAGGAARFVGQLGDDELAHRLLHGLALTGVDVVARHGGRTGSIVVLVDSTGERTMLTDRAAATELADRRAVVAGRGRRAAPARLLAVRGAPGQELPRTGGDGHGSGGSP